MTLIELLTTPLLCPRCYVGRDDDRDGNCAFCAGMSEQDAAQCRLNRLRVIATKISMDRESIQSTLTELAFWVPSVAGELQHKEKAIQILEGLA
jgi:hypothetical protein